MKSKTIRQRQILGDVVRIDLGDGFHTYGQVLAEADFAFFDARLKEEIPVDQIVARPVLFIVAVMKYAVTRGRWLKIGKSPPSDALMKVRPQFIQDPLHPDRFSIYERGNIRPAKKEECLGLDRAAVWDPSHVEDRLRDHYAGRKNKWVESLKIR